MKSCKIKKAGVGEEITPAQQDEKSRGYNEIKKLNHIIKYYSFTA